jgi:excisionase family DNA binding protein
MDALLLSAKDSASLIGISRSLFYQMLSSGRLPLKPIRFGRKTLFSYEELRDYVKAGCPARDEWLRIKGANR